jgi:hypothetical protein
MIELNLGPALPPTAKQLRATAEVLDLRIEGLNSALAEIKSTQDGLVELANSCRRRAMEMDKKPLYTRANRTGPKEKDFEL